MTNSTHCCIVGKSIVARQIFYKYYIFLFSRSLIEFDRPSKITKYTDAWNDIAVAAMTEPTLIWQLAQIVKIILVTIRSIEAHVFFSNYFGKYVKCFIILCTVPTLFEVPSSFKMKLLYCFVVALSVQTCFSRYFLKLLIF